MINPNRNEDRRDRTIQQRDNRGFKTPLLKPRTKTKTIEQALVPSQIVETELRTLESCERLMVKGFQDVARAWATIREAQLYKEVGCEDFGSYCERMGISRQRGDQFANAHFTIKSLPKRLATIVGNEAKARAISTIPEEKRAGVLSLVKKSGSVTAKSITVAARKSEPQVIDVEPEPSESKVCPTCKGSGRVQ